MIEKTINSEIQGIRLFELKKFGEERGSFWESFQKNKLNIDFDFVQDNIATSQKDVLRGLHFQSPPVDQGKFVQVIKGSVIDVIVDIRKNSTTYGQHLCVNLSNQNNLALWVPPGFAHGYLTLEDNTIFHYKCTNIYNPDSEGGLMWNDPGLNIDWGIDNPILSNKDKLNFSFNTFTTPFK